MNTAQFFDMHYGALLGAGWTSSDPGSVYSTTTSAAVSSGVYDIPVVGNLGFNPGMLIVYQGTDGQWYPFRLRETGLTLKSDRPLPMGMASGASLSNAYYDNAHPNVNGGAMIVDAALRQFAHASYGRPRQLEKIFREGTGAWTASGGASLSYALTDSYRFPGSDVVGERAATVSGSSAGGVDGAWFNALGGDYLAKVVVNTGNCGAGTSNTIEVVVEERDGTTVTQIATSGPVTGYDRLQVVEAPFSTAGSGKSVRVRVLRASGATWNFFAGQTEYHQLNGTLIDLSVGKHVLFGDSWATPGSPIALRMAARLPGATVVAKGIGGNKASQLIARFAADVTPEAPNFVWVPVGTNDFYAGVTPADFDSQIAALKSLINGIGATPIFFTPSVGDGNYSPPQLMPSRRYMTYVRYLDLVQPLPDTTAWKSAQLNAQALTLVPGETRIVLVTPGLTKISAVVRLLALDNPAIEVKVGYSSSPNGASPMEVSTYTGLSLLRNLWVRRTSDTALRFTCIALRNPGVSAETVSAVADLAWQDAVI